MIELGIKPYWSEAAPDNIASQRVLEKIGYKRVEEPVSKGGIIGADGELRGYIGDRLSYKTDEKALLRRIAELTRSFPPKTAKTD